MPELDTAEIVGLHQRVARRRHLLAAAERRQTGADQGPREQALAGAEAAGQADEIARPEPRRQAAGEALRGRGIRERQG